MLHNLRSISRQLAHRLPLMAWPSHCSVLEKACRSTGTLQRSKMSESHFSDNDLNRPIDYFGSPAAEWRARDTRSGGADESLWYQSYVISGSLTVFMLYFFFLRQENDVDEKLRGSLFDHIHGLEESQLVITYKYNNENSIDNTDVETRLAELGIDVKLLLAQ